MTLLVGTSGWQYKDWREPFYDGRPQRLWLEAYAEAFPTVEVNNAFYRLPERSTFEKWAAQVPEGFVVTVKASRYLTHVKRLKEPAEPVARLVDRARGLGDRLGPFLLQLPPNLRAAPDLLDARALRIERLAGLVARDAVRREGQGLARRHQKQVPAPLRGAVRNRLQQQRIARGRQPMQRQQVGGGREGAGDQHATPWGDIPVRESKDKSKRIAAGRERANSSGCRGSRLHSRSLDLRIFHPPAAAGFISFDERQKKRTKEKRFLAKAQALG